jgi:hypothetical protein
MLPQREVGETTPLLLELGEPIAQKCLDSLQSRTNEITVLSKYTGQSGQISIEHSFLAHIVLMAYIVVWIFKKSLHENEISLNLAGGRSME